MCLIIVEGKGDKNFVNTYIKFLESKGELQKNSKFKISSADSKNNIKSISEIEKHKKNLKIIFDADDDIEQAKENIQKQLKEIAKENNIDENSLLQAKIFLFPNNKDTGNLETLIENIAREKCILECFEQYKKCIEKLQEKNKNIKLPARKSKVFAYLESFGFKNGDKNFKFNEDIFDLDSEYLSPLKDFLLK